MIYESVSTAYLIESNNKFNFDSKFVFSESKFSLCIQNVKNTNYIKEIFLFFI